MHFCPEFLTNYVEVLEEADKAFVGNLSKDFVAQAQADIFFQLGIRDKELMKQGLTFVTRATAGYNKSMLDIVGKFQTGSLDYNTAFRQWRDATKTAMTGMYRGGGMSVGNPFFKDLKIPARELRLMSQYLNKEGAYFKQFLRDIKNPKHVPAREIPRDKFGKRLPGYRQQQWGYAERAGMYADSLKAMRYNGMVRGAGSNMEVFWVLGVPQTVHCPDCPVLSGRAWTGETLPTVPGAGDTKCGWKCYCHLEFRQKVSKTTFDLAGSSTRGALMAPGRQAKVIDPRGTEIGGQLQADVEGYMARMYKARQMIEVTTGAERMKWIAERKKWNRLAIERGEAIGARIVPTISSSALTKTIKSVQAKGGFLVSDFSTLAVGQEVWFVRGDYSSFGVIGMRAGQMVFKSPTGLVLRPVGEIDVLFSAPGKGKASSIYSKGTGKTLGEMVLDFEGSEAAEQMKRIFGSRWKEVNVSNLAEFYRPDGTQLSNLRVTATSAGIQIRADLVIKGKYAGEIDRSITRRLTATVITAENRIFQLEDFAQAKGFAKSQFRKMVSLYDDLGVARIEAYANGDVGRYAWAKYGFDFYSKEGLSGMKVFFKREIAVKYLNSPEIVKTLSAQIDGLNHSWDFASFTYKGELLGKEWMLKGPAWVGELDLAKGSMGRNMLDAYLGGK